MGIVRFAFCIWANQNDMVLRRTRWPGSVGLSLWLGLFWLSFTPCRSFRPTPRSSRFSHRHFSIDNGTMGTGAGSPLQVEPDATPTTDNDAEAPTSQPMSQWQLLQELGASFDYEGRMPMRATSEAEMTHENSALYRCGFVCIIGAPNMGKSTLLNALLQQDLSICTARPQTTRHAILGILTTATTQVCLVDTPGVIASPAYKLQQGMMEAVVTAVRDADVLLVVTDVYSTPIPNDKLFAKVQTTNKPVIVVINKIDLAANATARAMEPAVAMATLSTAVDDSSRGEDDEPPPKPIAVTVDEAVAQWRQLVPQAVAIIPVAASEGWDQAGVVALRRLLCGDPDLGAAWRALGRPIPGMLVSNNGTMYQDSNLHDLLLLPQSPPLFDQDALTDRTERFVASEIIRAALFETLKKELPYCCEVQVTEFKDPAASAATAPAHKDKTIIRISANVIVERDSQKIIVIGKNGAQIKQVGVIARTKLEDFLQAQVFLTLNVKVNKDWRSKETQLKAYGYLT